MINLISKITPPHVAFRIIGKNHNSCNVSDGAHSRAYRLFLCLLVLLFAGAVVWMGFRNGRRQDMVWVANRPALYAPIFYNPDSLDHYIFIAYHEDNAEALAIAGTAAYNVRVFDKASADSLPAVSLDEADIMLLRAAELHYDPAVMVIMYLDQLDLWHHSLPTYIPESFAPQPHNTDYKKM